MSTELQNTIAELGTAFEEFKAQHASRMDGLEVQLDHANISGGNKSTETPEQREHLQVFEAWVRTPHSQSAKAQLLEIEQKHASSATDAAGGYLVPEILANRLANRVRDLSPMRQVANVMPVSSANFKHPLSNNNATSGWAGENDTRNATDEPDLEEAAPTFGMSYALVSASEELLMDAAFPVGQWLINSASDALAEQEGTAFVSGNGTKKPTGFLQTTPEATGDSDSPARTYPALEYIPTGDASGFGSLSTTSPEFYPSDVLVTLVYSVKAAYRARGRFMMNSATAGVIRKMRDADGRFIWTDSLAEGQPALLLGYPVTINEQMPDIATNAFPVAFGDFQRGYLIAEQGGLRITTDDNITTPGKVRWYVRRRVGGATLDNNAIKLLKVAAS